MIDTRICGWLMDNGDAPIRYRTARELLNDSKTAVKIENELFDNKDVQKWLDNLAPHDPPRHWNMEHGSFDFNLENAMLKCVQLGLHGDMPQMRDAAEHYINKLKKEPIGKPFRQWNTLFISNFLGLAGINDAYVWQAMSGSLDELYDFTQKKTYDIYLSPEEKVKLVGIPKIWDESKFIKPEMYKEYGYRYPLIYDIIGMHKLYDINEPDVDKKINAVIDYISTDDFHNSISDGYGILSVGKYASGSPRYHSMGWDPKYPGWFDAAGYLENINAPKLLFFAAYISMYAPARKTRWFSDVLAHLVRYRTKNGTYMFPKEWLKESPGYAVQGHHLSFGESRRKKNWVEIESTFYMQLLTKSIT